MHLSGEIMACGGNPGSLNHNISFMTVFEGRLFYIGCLATTDVVWVGFYSGSKAKIDVEWVGFYIDYQSTAVENERLLHRL